MKKLMKCGMSIAAVMMLTGCGSKTLTLNDYITGVTFSGADGEGTAEVEFDMDQFDKDLSEALDIKASDLSLSDFGSYFTVLSAYELEVDPATGLSNGDTVTVKGTVDNDVLKDNKIKVRLKVEEQEYTVEGLTVLERLSADDILNEKNVKLTFNGADPFIWISYVTNVSEDPIISKYFTFQAEDTHNLKNGDSVTINAIWNDDILKNAGYTVDAETVSKKFTIESQPSYAQKLSDIDDDFRRAVIEKIEEEYINGDDTAYGHTTVRHTADTDEEFMAGATSITYDNEYLYVGDTNSPNEYVITATIHMDGANYLSMVLNEGQTFDMKVAFGVEDVTNDGNGKTIKDNIYIYNNWYVYSDSSAALNGLNPLYGYGYQASQRAFQALD